MTTATRIQVTGVHDAVAACTKPVVVSVGGAGSSKSHSMAQLFCHILTFENDKVMGIARKTMPALRMTAMKLVVERLQELGVYQYVAHNKSENTIRFKNNLIQFFSLDEPDKIKSFVANYIWLEEANEFTWNDYTIIKLRLNRNPVGDTNQMYLSLNPVDENCWVKAKLCDDPSVDVVHSTYKDNPFAPGSWITELEKLISQDANYYRIYALGEWGRLENVIYPDWTLVDEMPMDAHIDRYGIDFGYENATAVEHIMLTGRELYIDELVYRTHITNADLIQLLMDFPKRPMYADSAEPQRIEELCRAGFECYPAIKHVQAGIDRVKRCNIHFTKRSVGIIKEVRGYSRRTDRQGHVLEEPIKYEDHGLDSVRYGILGSDKPVDKGVIIYDTMEELGFDIDL